MKHLTLYDYRDLDLMLKLEEIGNDEGWASTHDLASSLGMDDDARAVGGRCGWMRRFGIFDYDEKTKLWRLSAGGQRVSQAKIRAAAEKAVANIPDESMIEVMAHVTSRYRQGDALMATMLRREFQFGTRPSRNGR
jgi:hypothetical protein